MRSNVPLRGPQQGAANGEVSLESLASCTKPLFPMQPTALFLKDYFCRSRKGGLRRVSILCCFRNG
jgi:hypothetical protein